MGCRCSKSSEKDKPTGEGLVDEDTVCGVEFGGRGTQMKPSLSLMEEDVLDSPLGSIRDHRGKTSASDAIPPPVSKNTNNSSGKTRRRFPFFNSF